jgi:predicted GNAT family acetyltransferase
MKTEEYIQKAKEKGLEVSDEDLFVKPSTMEKKNITSPKHWKYLKDIYRTDQLFEVFQELILLYTVEAEISRREREVVQSMDIERLEKKQIELEKIMKDDTLRHVKSTVNKMKAKKKSDKK